MLKYTWFSRPPKLRIIPRKYQNIIIIRHHYSYVDLKTEEGAFIYDKENQSRNLDRVVYI